MACRYGQLPSSTYWLGCSAFIIIDLIWAGSVLTHSTLDKLYHLSCCFVLIQLLFRLRLTLLDELVKHCRILDIDALCSHGLNYGIHDLVKVLNCARLRRVQDI